MIENDTVRHKVRDEVFESPEHVVDELVREGVRLKILDALLVEAEDYMERAKDLVGPDGRRLVRLSGTLPEKTLRTGTGPLRIKQPRVRDGREGHKFTSAILPPYQKQAPSMDIPIPVLYFRGVLTGDFSEALKAVLGLRSAGMSPANMVTLKNRWKMDHEHWNQRELNEKRYACWWAAGIRFNVPKQKDWSCMLVLMGATDEGKRELVVVGEGHRESKASWQTMLKDLKHRGLSTGSGIAIGDGVLGFWAALEEEYPDTAEHRCETHKIASVLC